MIDGSRTRYRCRSGLRYHITVLVSLCFWGGWIQFIAGFPIGRFSYRESTRNPVCKRQKWRRCFGGKAEADLPCKGRINSDGEEKKTKEFQSLAFRKLFLSPTTLIPLIILPSIFIVSQPVLAADHLLASISVPLNDIDPRYFLAGALCASFSHGITTPVDVIKTRIQSDPQKYDGLNILGASKIVLNGDGYGTLLKGFLPTVLGYGLEGAAKFGLYESLKPAFVGLMNLENPNTAYIIASIVAGGAASIILCPLERTRIRLVTDPDFSGCNILTGISRLVEESGVLGLFYGLSAMLSKQCPYTLGKQVTYDTVCTALYSVLNNANNASTRVEVSLFAASCAAIVACVLSQPGDVILTETYKGKSSSAFSRSFSRVVVSIYDEGQGVAGFYTGLSARLIQVGGIITSQLLLYDIIKQSLGLPATGLS